MIGDLGAHLHVNVDPLSVTVRPRSGRAVTPKCHAGLRLIDKAENPWQVGIISM